MTRSDPLNSQSSVPVRTQFPTLTASSARSVGGRPRIAHSQTTALRQPSSVNACNERLSRARLASIFVFQNSALVRGSRNSGQSCPCQKQPFTKTTALTPGNDRSGRPGSFRLCSRYRRPCACSALRSTSSILVSRPLMPAIIRLRVAASTTSTQASVSCEAFFSCSMSVMMAGFMALAAAAITGMTTEFPNCR